MDLACSLPCVTPAVLLCLTMCTLLIMPILKYPCGAWASFYITAFTVSLLRVFAALPVDKLCMCSCHVCLALYLSQSTSCSGLDLQWSLISCDNDSSVNHKAQSCSCCSIISHKTAPVICPSAAMEPACRRYPISHSNRPYRNARNLLLWKDMTCPARTYLIMSWKAL